MILRIVLGACAASFVVAQAKPKLASQLQEGMRLEYAADPGPASSWLVGRVESVDALKPGAECMRFVVQKGPTAGSADSLTQCTSGDTLFSLGRGGTVTPMRVVGPSMRLELKRSAGTNVFETGALAADTVNGVVIPVVITTYTVNVGNQPIQQLRERFALSLGTATRGAFYEADPGTEGGWKLQRTFRIERIQRP